MIMLFRNRVLAAVAMALFGGAACADIQHIVVFRYKANVTAEKKAEIARKFLELRNLAHRNGQPYITSIKGGDAISKEGFDRGLEQAFVVSFKNEADRNFFVGKPYGNEMDPAHRALAQIVEPLLATDEAGKPVGLFVFDFDDARFDQS
jgi:hypothetical protein